MMALTVMFRDWNVRQSKRQRFGRLPNRQAVAISGYQKHFGKRRLEQRISIIASLMYSEEMAANGVGKTGGSSWKRSHHPAFSRTRLHHTARSRSCRGWLKKPRRSHLRPSVTSPDWLLPGSRSTAFCHDAARVLVSICAMLVSPVGGRQLARTLALETK
jgi:hypothetical protein